MKKIVTIVISVVIVVAAAIIFAVMSFQDKTVPVGVWTSSVNKEDTGMDKALTPETGEAFSKASNIKPDFTINVDENKTYQQMDGFGVSITDASAWLINDKLDSQSRTDLMTKLFDKTNGIGISMLRQPIGACDHVLSPYTYDDKPDTDSLPNFTIEHDDAYIIPVLKQALAVNQNRIKVIAATWSPPGWMKANNSELGSANGIKGTLLPDKYNAYANYLAKFIKAYEGAGIPIYATTIQNEPLNDTGNWPAMYFTASEEAAFIKNNLVSSFKSNNITSKIICFDHNWDIGKDYVSAILGDSAVSKDVAGSAWHWYGGDMSIMSDIHDAYPDKGIWFTEGSGGDWDPVKSWREGFITEIMDVIRLPRNWSKSIVWWNAALDETNGPDYYYTTYMKTHSTCRGLVTINKNTGSISYNLDYYTLGHISKFVDPGAYRIDSNTFTGSMENVAFKNPDGTKVLIVYNVRSDEKNIRISWNGKTFDYKIQGMTAATFKW